MADPGRCGCGFWVASALLHILTWVHRVLLSQASWPLCPALCCLWDRHVSETGFLQTFHSKIRKLSRPFLQNLKDQSWSITHIWTFITCDLQLNSSHGKIGLFFNDYSFYIYLHLSLSLSLYIYIYNLSLSLSNCQSMKLSNKLFLK